MKTTAELTTRLIALVNRRRCDGFVIQYFAKHKVNRRWYGRLFGDCGESNLVGRSQNDVLGKMIKELQGVKP